MSAKRLLYFTASRARAVSLGARRARARGALRARRRRDSAGFREPPAAGAAARLFYVVADLAGEDFHEDQIPYLRGSDRAAGASQRRLAQRYRDTRLAAALSLGTVSGERRNERLLLASFTNTQQFTPWLDALAESGARLAGVYSVPLLAPALAAAARRAQRARLRGHREQHRPAPVLRRGRAPALRAPGAHRGHGAGSAAPRSCAPRPMRLAQYLATLRALPRDGPPVQVLVVAPAGQRAAFEQALVSDARLVFRTVDTSEAARKVGVKRWPPGAAGEQLFLHLAVQAARPRSSSPASRTGAATSSGRLQRAIAFAGAAGFAACALYAGAQLIGLLGAKDETSAPQARGAIRAQQYDRITASFPVTQTTTDNLKATVIEFTKIATQSLRPRRRSSTCRRWWSGSRRWKSNRCSGASASPPRSAAMRLPRARPRGRPPAPRMPRPRSCR